MSEGQTRKPDPHMKTGDSATGYSSLTDSREDWRNMEDHITADLRFSIIPHWLLNTNVSNTGLRLYAVLAKFADAETGQAFPGRTRLSRELDCSLKTVDRAVAELMELGAIRKTQRVKDGHYQSSLYTVVRIDPASGVTRPRDTDDATPRHERRDPVSSVTHRTITTEQEPLKPEPLNDMFDQFWKIYPIKKDKPKARRAFEKALKRASLQTILDGATRYRDDPNREDKYTKYPEGWLNNDAWENGPLPAPKPHRANWEDAADLARKYREQETAAIEYESKETAEALEADAITWLKGVDDD